MDPNLDVTYLSSTRHVTVTSALRLPDMEVNRLCGLPMTLPSPPPLALSSGVAPRGLD